MSSKVRLLARELDAKAATHHFCIIGTTGSGKSLTIQIMLKGVLGDLCNGTSPDHRALIYDAKKDAHKMLDRMGFPSERVKTLNPFDKDCYEWNMAEDIDSPSSALELASILIPELEESQPFFSDAARDLLSGVIGFFIFERARRKRNGERALEWSFRDVLLAMRSKERIMEILSRHPHLRDRLAYFVNDKTGAEIMATIRTKLAPYEIVAACWHRAIDEKTGKKRTISLRDWVEQERTVLILGASETNRQAIDTINRVLFRRIVQLVLDQEESEERRTWFFLDELRQMGQLKLSNVNILGSLFTQGRSKGASVVIAIQDIDGLRALYGADEANEILAQCNTKVILRVSSPSTAQWACDLAGKQLAKEEDYSETFTDNRGIKGWPDRFASGDRVSKSRNLKLIERDRILAGWFMDRPPTNRKNGIHGFYMTPFLEGTEESQEQARMGKKFEIPPDLLSQLLGGRLSDSPYRSVTEALTTSDNRRRPPEDEYLNEWEAHELETFGLVPERELGALARKIVNGNANTDRVRDKPKTGAELLNEANDF
jgi:type IV secretory pathway TraG/TraD family ATPase VirD4